MKKQIYLLSFLSVIPLSSFAAGSGDHHHEHHQHSHHQHGQHQHGQHQQSHQGKISYKSSAPAAVMGDHIHKAGEFMVSYRRMEMFMDGNRQGTDRISLDEIVTSLDNPSGMPPKVRVAPVEMRTSMDMLGVMYGFTDQINGFVMLNYLRKDMDHQTYAGPSGTNVRGRFNVTNEGLGDTKVGFLYQPKSNHQLTTVYKLGLSIPTGSIDEEAEVLTPMNTRPTLRSPYAMQLGSGTYDLLPAITLKYVKGACVLGAQYSGTIRTGTNDEDYRLGNRHEITSWGAIALNEKVSLNTRLALQQVDAIKGRDSQINAPIQTANPDNYERFDALVGAGFEYRFAPTAYENGIKLVGEYLLPVYQDVDGVQMDREGMLTLGLKTSF